MSKPIQYAILLLLLITSVPQTQAAPGGGGHAHGEPKSVHGMLLFGSAPVFASHLPMFHAPHDAQAIFEISLSPEAQAAYVADRRAHPGETVYTLVPEPFALFEMIQRPRPFMASIFRGHFERGGTQIVGRAQVGVRKVVFARKLNPAGPGSPVPGFLVFGPPGQAFAAHLITARPDFDQVLAVSVLEPAANAALAAGRVIEVTPLAAAGNLPVAASAQPVPARTLGSPSLPVTFGQLAPLYLEFDDLAM